MTLILTIATFRLVVQASDRRLTFPDGTLADDKSNKALCVFCQDAVMALGYTGLALTGSSRTDEYLVDVLGSIKAGTSSVVDTVQQLSNRLTSDFRSPAILGLEPRIRRLSVVGAGFRGPDTFLVQISNFERWKPAETCASAKDSFDAEWMIQRGTKRALALAISGDIRSVSADQISRLKALRKRRFFHNSSGEVIADRMVKLIRATASAQPLGRKTIGSNCMATWVAKDGGDAQSRFYDADGNSMSYAPNIIHPIGSIKGVEMQLPPGFSVRFFGHDDDRGPKE